MIEGFRFLIVGAENKPTNHGTIIEKVTEGKYLCQLNRMPTSCRVVDVDEIQKWNLFPTEEGLNAFIAALTPISKPPDDTIPNGTTPPDPAPPGGPKPNPRPRKMRAKRNGKKAKQTEKNGK